MSNKNLTDIEAFVKKRFKQDNYHVTKLDIDNTTKSPDFKIQKGKFAVLVEVKRGFKKGKILETLSTTDAFRYDPSQAIEDYFREASKKREEYLRRHPEDSHLPYILVFMFPFFINNVLEWSDTPYKKHPDISAVFIPKKVHPLDDKAWDMSLEELEKVINSEKIPINSQTKLKWRVIKNSYAYKPLETSNFTSIVNVKYPLNETQINTINN